MRDWQAIWRRLFPKKMIARDVDAELRFHVDGRASDLVDQGLSPEEARAEVLRRLGDLEQLSERCTHYTRQRIEREEFRTMVEFLGQDIRFAARTLVKNAGFSLVVILTLALGIGASTAMFSVVSGVLLRPLPYEEPGTLAVIWENDRATGTVREAASVPDYFDFRARTRAFRDIAMYAFGPATMTRDDGEPSRVDVAVVTHNLAAVLGVGPQLGRAFSPEEDRPGGDLVAMLSDSFWRSAFNADEAVLGHRVRIDGQMHTIVGVLPPALDFPVKGIHLWTPIQQNSSTTPRSSHWVRQIGRLAPGITIAEADEEMAGIAAELEAEFPENVNRGAFVEPLEAVLRGDLRLTVWVLFGAVSAVLLTACANVANLLLARGAGRSQEIAICVAMGASTKRLVRRFLMESLLLSGIAAALGVVLALFGLRSMMAIAPPAILGIGAVEVDLGVLGFALATSLLIGTIFGLIPTLQAARRDVQKQLKEGRSRGQASTASKMWLRRALVGGQLALAVMLLVAAGLLIGTLWNLQRVDPGFSADNVLRLDVQLPEARYPRDFSVWPDWAEVNSFNRDVLAGVEALPGVRSAALTSNHPLQSGFTNSFSIVGRPPDPDQGEMTTRIVSMGYFDTVGVRLLRGRMIASTDTTDAPPVLLLNQAAVDRYFPDEEAIGRQIQLWGPISREIIGVVDNERMHGLDRTPPPAMYVNIAQAPQVTGVTLMVRTAGNPRQIIPAVRETIWSIDGDLAVFRIATMEETLAGAVARERFASALLAIFAAVAVFIASLGVYGLLGYLVAQRRHEVGVRMALGATPRDVLSLVVSQGLAMTGAGLAAGLIGAVMVSRLLESLLFGISPTDPLAYIVVGLSLTSAALVACALPARRAARIDPVVSLRGE